ncbi:MAG: UDP-3-O-acyl-N-acetylglucosamine deacetylase [Myxococcales bacterium]|nr:UDP-3-O-acyl-N-acetylglucosamine deacetylase [Myxococcales bacterium]
MDHQHTLRRSIAFAGVGLHSGERIEARVLPAPAGSGVVFIRTDTDRRVAIPAVREFLGDTTLATTLTRDGTSISTVEHILAALAGMGVDNARVEVHGPEVPILDGSAAPFVDLIRRAGVVRQEMLRHYLRLKKSIIVEEGDRWIEARPIRSVLGPAMILDCTIEFDHPLITKQSRRWLVEDASFARDVAPARTFGFLKDVEFLKAIGLAKGGGPDNAVVLGDDEVLNPEGVRFDDEFVRHKLLDMLGDFALLGMPLIGEVISHKGGHHLNQLLVAKILEEPRAWEVVERPFMAARAVNAPYETGRRLAF